MNRVHGPRVSVFLCVESGDVWDSNPCLHYKLPDYLNRSIKIGYALTAK